MRSAPHLKTFARLIMTIGFDSQHFHDLCLIFDKNFEGVIRNYMLLNPGSGINPSCDLESPLVRTPSMIPETIVASQSVPADVPGTNKIDANYVDYVLDHDIQELKELESDIDDLTIAISFQYGSPATNLKAIGNKLLKYSHILISYPVFTDLGNFIGSLGHHFLNSVALVKENPEILSNVTVLIESFVNDLIAWRQEVFDRAASDPNFLNQSFKSNVDTIINFMSEPGEDDNGDLEFF